MFTQFLISQFFGGQRAPGNAGSRDPIPAFHDRPDMGTVTNASFIPQNIAPIWSPDSSLDISIYISSSLEMPSLASVPKENNVLEEKNFIMRDWEENREIVTSFTVPKGVQQNGTLWGHFYVGLSGQQLDPTIEGYDPATAFHFARPLNQYLPKKKTAKLKNLLTANETDSVDVTPKEVQIGSFYHSNFTISVIPDSGTQNFYTMHPAMRQFVQLERTRARDSSGQNGWYYPIVFVNTFWQLRKHMIELNSTVETLPLHISLNNMKNWKFGIVSSIDEGMKQNQRQAASGGPMPAGGDGSELEMLKEVMLDTNSYLLATTGIVSVLHMVFEGLAFKNDIVSISILVSLHCQIA